MYIDAIGSFWGKARPNDASACTWHPLAWHMLDVGASAQAILMARPRGRRVMAELLGLEDSQAIRLAILVATLHDLGKFAATFQRKASGPDWLFSKPRDARFGMSEHDRDGLALWRQCLAPKLASRIWPGAEKQLDRIMAASTGHHGRAVDANRCDPAESFLPEGMAAAQDFATALIDLLLPVPVISQQSAKAVGAATFWFSGFVTIADWVGSTQKYFPYCKPDIPIDAYWQIARAKAAKAVHALGLATAQTSEAKSFAALTGKESPTPLQSLAETMDLPDGPVLVVIEDITGAGKTEAAQILVHRLMTAGRASGAYWAMPTQATANAMYARQHDAIANLFADGERPQLALAHGGARLHEGFQETILRQAGDSEVAFGRAEPDETATAACAAFLADDARAALIADVGAGTIDQAILGVLPARFQAVRLFGLSDKVLIVDEAHAYDTYVSEELRGLLQFHAALGGSAVVLSATLPRDVKNKAGREQIANEWLLGCGVPPRELRGKRIVEDDSYPLVTIVSRDKKAIEIPVEAATWSCRDVPVRFVQKSDEAIDDLVRAANAGAAVAWVRNTVEDVLAVIGEFRKRGLDPIIFHARFAQEDRQRIESMVMKRAGLRADAAARRGMIVLATQVIEQSLDLDFDLMVSDLAPIDLLIQRAGRLRRHRVRDAARPPVPFELIVNAPSFDENPDANWLSDELKNTEFVYRDPALLWRSMRALMSRGKIETPGGLRGLIEEVYGADAEIPPGLDPKSLKAEGAARAEGGQARQNLLLLENGYSAEQVAWVAEERVQVRTRLGNAQSTLRLARVGADGSLRPWAEAAGPTCAEPTWRQWALSEVRISAYRAPGGCLPLPSFQAAAKVARCEWGKREQDRPDLLLLPLEPEGTGWAGGLVDSDGRELKFAYDSKIGLQFSHAR